MARTVLAVDVDHATDDPGANQTLHGSLDLGKGLSVSRGPNTDPITFDLITAAAHEAGIAIQPASARAAPGRTPTSLNEDGRGDEEPARSIL